MNNRDRVLPQGSSPCRVNTIPRSRADCLGHTTAADRGQVRSCEGCFLQEAVKCLGFSFYAHQAVVDEFWKQMEAKSSAVNSAFWNGHVPEMCFGNIGGSSGKQGE